MLRTLVPVLNQGVSDEIGSPGWSVVVVIAIIVGLYALVAVLVRRRLGPVALWLLALLPTALFVSKTLSILRSYPTGYEHNLLIVVLVFCVLIFALAPTATIWMATRRPNPPSYWKQVGLAVAVAYATALALWLISFAVNTFGPGWGR